MTTWTQLGIHRKRESSLPPSRPPNLSSFDLHLTYASVS
jgi:hypothetical protein